MTFPAPDVTSEALAKALGATVTPEQAEDYRATALDLLALAFEDSWRDPSIEVANTCLVRVCRALRDETKAVRGKGQLATVEGGTGTRAPSDPLAPVRPLLAVYVVPL